MGVAPDIADQTIRIPTSIPTWLVLWRRIHEHLVRMLSSPIPPVAWSARLVHALLFRIYIILPDQIEQSLFSREAVRRLTSDPSQPPPDLVHINNGLAGIRAIRRSPWAELKLLVTGHGGIGRGEQISLRQHPDLYVAMTDTAAEWAKAFSPHVRTVPHGVDERRFRPSRRRHPPPELVDLPRPIVLCVAAFTPFKRQHLLIDAMARWGKGSLILIGQGELAVPLKSRGGQKLGPKRFRILSVPYHDMPRYYRSSDIFSLPSLDEPFGIVYLEAMASNLPVVAPDDPPRRAIVGPAGVLCDVTDADRYAAALESAASRRWKDLPRRRVLEHFTWRKVARQYAELYQELLRNPLPNDDPPAAEKPSTRL